ncbi:MAG: DUF177 domain-containing protein [Cellvibrionaceae bacterium]|nr:DUF177 domain-containing protein [Cellvibrionaceae bacterium]
MSEGTSSKVLPRLLEPRKLVQLGAVFKGIVPGDLLSRLADATVALPQFRAELHFVLGDGGERLMRGKIHGPAVLQCQRCLEPMNYTLSAEFALAVVWDEAQAMSLPKYLDPWIVTEQEADLYQILEEELLLSMPVVAYHEHHCIDSKLLSAGEAVSETSQQSDNPFDVLKQLKKEQSAD